MRPLLSTRRDVSATVHGKACGATVRPVGWQQLQVWNYRFGGIEGDCVVFQVSISNATQTVTDAGPNTDPACDHGPDRS